MRFAVFAALLLLLSACQPLPHPFAQDIPPPNSPILRPPDSAGVMVLPVVGAPEPMAHDLAAAMADALRNDDVPASTDASNRGSFRLTGAATTKDAGNGNLSISIDWEMRDADDVLVSHQKAVSTMAATEWRHGGKDVAELVHESAPFLARMVESTAPPPLVDDPLIDVRAVTGAPGDGDQSLGLAIADALRHANLAVVKSPADKPSFVLQGSVAVSPPDNGKQQIRISWSLLRADGGQIGEVKQENAVPAGSLNGAWGLTAYDVANAAAPGIAALIAERKKVDASS